MSCGLIRLKLVNLDCEGVEDQSVCQKILRSLLKVLLQILKNEKVELLFPTTYASLLHAVENQAKKVTLANVSKDAISVWMFWAHETNR